LTVAPTRFLARLCFEAEANVAFFFYKVALLLDLVHFFSDNKLIRYFRGFCIHFVTITSKRRGTTKTGIVEFREERRTLRRGAIFSRICLHTPRCIQHLSCGLTCNSTLTTAKTRSKPHGIPH